MWGSLTPPACLATALPAGIYVSSSGTGCEADASCFIPTLVEGNLGALQTGRTTSTPLLHHPLPLLSAPPRLVRDIRGYNYGGNGAYTDENVAGVYFVGNA